MMIEPGDPGTINATISGDTMDDGSRIHNVYMLRRGATYLYTSRINNVGYPLMVIAEEGDGPLPLIKALGPPPGEDEAPRAFHAQGDLYLKDLRINGYDQTDSPTDNATVRLAADSVRVVLRGILFEFNRQNAIRINGSDCEVYVENSVIGPQGNSFNIFNGIPLNFRGNFTPMVHFRNTSFFSLSRGLMENFGAARYGTMIIEHCTMVNSGVDGAEFGRPDSLIFTDNLIINTGILGDGFDGDRSEFIQPLFAFMLDSNNVATDTVIVGTDTTINFENVEPYVEFERNHFYNKPIIAQTIPDSSRAYMADSLFFDEELSEDIEEEDENVVAQEDFEFTNFNMPDDQFTAFINDYYDLVLDQAEIPGFDNDITEIDLTYDPDHPAATAARSGQPVGDLTWWGLDIINATYQFQNLAVNIFPNPTTDRIRVELENLQSVLVYDLAGKLVRITNDLRGPDTAVVNVADLSAGTYFVVALTTDRRGVTRKIVKQ